jgi:ABC-type dipeptide/oligopeptide/nickel transport system permease subunit
MSVGLVAAYRGGIVESILMRIVDTFLAFPALVLALVIAASLGPGIRNTIIAIAVVPQMLLNECPAPASAVCLPESRSRNPCRPA